MKTLFMTLATALLLGLISCDRDGNTGNGANDPTDKFESDKTKKNADFYGRTTNADTDSTTNEGSTNLNTVDTTMIEGRHK